MVAHEWLTSDFLGTQWSFCFIAEELKAARMKKEPLGSFACIHSTNIIELTTCQALFYIILDYARWKQAVWQRLACRRFIGE